MKILIVGENEAELPHICLRTPSHYEFTFAENLEVALAASPELYDLVFVVTNGDFRESAHKMHVHFQRLELVDQFHQRVRFLVEAPGDWRKPINVAVECPLRSWQR